MFHNVGDTEIIMSLSILSSSWGNMLNIQEICAEMYNADYKFYWSSGKEASVLNGVDEVSLELRLC